MPLSGAGKWRFWPVCTIQNMGYQHAPSSCYQVKWSSGSLYSDTLEYQPIALLSIAAEVRNPNATISMRIGLLIHSHPPIACRKDLLLRCTQCSWSTGGIKAGIYHARSAIRRTDSVKRLAVTRLSVHWSELRAARPVCAAASASARSSAP
ncbi:hypothetical protein HHJ39_00060 [Escherichia coli]|nr:hypothetical protein HHJ39_00060 [Escherichia coli]